MSAEAEQTGRKIPGKARKEERPKFKSLKEAGLENFVIEEMARAQLTAAKYNPRKITDVERDKLKAALKKHGLVAPVIWNRRTQNLVGGHQRIGIMDSLMGTQEYTLQVSVIDVDEKQEREINVLLNNSQAMGTFDLDMLKDVFSDADVTIMGAGFSQNDMVAMFGTGVFDNRNEDLTDFATHLAEISEKYNKVAEANKKKGENENYLVFVFPSGDAVDVLIAKKNWPPNRYQNGAGLLADNGIEWPPKS